jgi:hypothetical protein
LRLKLVPLRELRFLGGRYPRRAARFMAAPKWNRPGITAFAAWQEKGETVK